jgi:hypothetical protein
MTPRPLLALTGATLVVLSASGCSTSFDASIANTTTTVAVTTTLPGGTVAELLPRMLAEVEALSEKVAANSGDAASATLIEQLWTAMEPEITAEHEDLVPAFEFVVRRCRAAADRSRPADADRAYRNLQSLADGLLPG